MKTRQVFLSHTSDMGQFPEGRSFVQAAMDAVGRAQLAAVDMRYFAARNDRPSDYCKRQVVSCDIYVAVVGFRYGTLVPGEGVSFTELEFLTAGAAGLPRLVFLLAETARQPDRSDIDRGPVEDFRKRLSGAGLLVREFTSSHSLELEVFHALRDLADAPAPAPAPANPPGASGPRIWSAPGRNADFTGRTTVLERLRHELTGRGRAAVLAQALYGLGGVGKTQLALEFAHRFHDDYDLIWWVPAEQPQAITLALAALADRLGIPPSDNAADTAAFALEELRRGAGGRWLIIFDNAEQPADLEPYLPGGPGHVIITSRNHAWTRLARPVELDVFTREESIAHLTRHVPGLSEDEAVRISAAVGDLPLAIEQAGAWLAETGMPVWLYIEHLESQAAEALGLSEPFGYAAPVAATWNMSLGRLRKNSPASLRLLQVLAFCSPEPVSAALLYGDRMRSALCSFDIGHGGQFAIAKVIGEAARLALIKVHQAGASVQMHRLVQAVIRSEMTDEEQDAARRTVHEILADARPGQGDSYDPANWPAYDIIWPHLEPSRAEESDNARTRELFIDWVGYQRVRGELDAAAQLATRLRRLWASSLGPDDPQTLSLRFQLGNVLRNQGQFSAARELDADTLMRQQAVLGASHTETLATANSLGADLRALGEFRSALTLDRETCASFSKNYSPDYVPALRAANNLACSLRQAGDFPAARRLDEQTLERWQKVAGPGHFATLRTAANLGGDLRETGALRESVELLQASYNRRRMLFGDQTLGTLLIAKSLAVSLRRAGELDNAMRLSLEIYDRYLNRYGPRAPDSLSCALNLASDYWARGDHAQALGTATDVHAAYRETLASGHLYTLAAASNLAAFSHDAGDRDRAIALAAHTLGTMRAALGAEHPFTLSCSLNLSGFLGDAGDLAQAESLQRGTVRVLQKTRGAGHPETLSCEANLAVTLKRAGDDHGAKQIRTRVLAELGGVLGPRHPATTPLRDWRYITCDIEPQPF